MNPEQAIRDKCIHDENSKKIAWMDHLDKAVEEVFEKHGFRPQILGHANYEEMKLYVEFDNGVELFIEKKREWDNFPGWYDVLAFELVYPNPHAPNLELSDPSTCQLLSAISGEIYSRRMAMEEQQDIIGDTSIAFFRQIVRAWKDFFAGWRR